MENKNRLAFGRQNYLLMLVGIVLLIIGFFVMSADDQTFGFGTLGLTIGPMIVLAGFVVEFFAILRKPGTNK
jgi:ATP/ADP translocase